MATTMQDTTDDGSRFYDTPHSLTHTHSHSPCPARSSVRLSLTQIPGHWQRQLWPPLLPGLARSPLRCNWMRSIWLHLARFCQGWSPASPGTPAQLFIIPGLHKSAARLCLDNAACFFSLPQLPSRRGSASRFAFTL